MSTISCDLKCANGGYCSLYPHESSLFTSIPVDGSLHQICVCPLGYTGLTCSEPTTELDPCHEHDGTYVCRHGGMCVEQTKTTSSSNHSSSEWMCECVMADEVNAFAGAMCRQPATEYCNASGSSFCTNGGTCVSNLVHLEFQVSGECICPPEFTGPHCEFLKVLVEKQNKPHSFLEKNPEVETKHQEERDGHQPIVPLLLGLAVASTLIFGVWFRKRNRGVNRDCGRSSSRRLKHPNPVFPLASLGCNNSSSLEGESSDDEYTFHDVPLT